MAEYLYEVAARLVGHRFRQLVLPSLVAIYAHHSQRPGVPVQVGTGFAITHSSRPVLITAKHVLRGHSFTEDPGEKAIHLNGAFVNFDALSLSEPSDRDLAATYLDDLGLERCLLESSIADDGELPALLTMGGYLARDFKREGDVLSPAPRIYTNRSRKLGSGFVGLSYPKRRNIYSDTGAPAVAPKPSGLSGGPIVDTAALMRGRVKIVGVFTEQAAGEARGEDLNGLAVMLAALR